jgi:hypothetical protein
MVHTLPPEIWIPILNEVFTPLYVNDIECSELYGGLTGRAGISRFLRVLFVLSHRPRLRRSWIRRD